MFTCDLTGTELVKGMKVRIITYKYIDDDSNCYTLGVPIVYDGTIFHIFPDIHHETRPRIDLVDVIDMDGLFGFTGKEILSIEIRN